jgi:glycosyltransferase involved in cell wall biosynthesis
MISTGGYAAFFNRRPLVMTAWGSDVLVAPKISRRQRAVTSWRLRRCDLVTVDSQDLKQAVMSLGVDEKKIEIIQWGIDVELMQSVRKDRTLRTVLGVPADAFVVLSTRRFERIYNLESIIRAVPHVLARAHGTIIFAFVGGGSLWQELQTLADSCRVADHVRFLGEFSHGDLARIYGGADAYVSVPLSDSTSVSLLEALAVGLPVVVSNLKSNREWIRHEWNGYVVPAQDPIAIADAVLRLASRQDTLREFGERNLNLAAEKADCRIHMRRMEQLYQALLDRSRAQLRRG